MLATRTRGLRAGRRRARIAPLRLRALASLIDLAVVIVGIAVVIVAAIGVVRLVRLVRGPRGPRGKDAREERPPPPTLSTLTRTLRGNRVSPPPAPLHSESMSLRRTAVALGVTMLALAAAAPAGAARPRYYLSLGDSLAQGMQPNAAGLTLNTDQGYADQLYAVEKHRIPGLRLVKLGCGGETTTSFLTGHGNAADALLLGCHPAGGSQMAAAERFLRRHRHRGEVALLTLDIGANDVDGCETEGTIATDCVIRGVNHIAANLPLILRRLRRAASPGTPMAAMTLYDPFLALYLTPGDQEEAITSVKYSRNVNEGLARLYRAAGFRVAHVDTAFHTYDTGGTRTLAGQSHPVPVAVAEVCRLTWMCAPPPVGPNIHANPTGYHLIAEAFARAFA